MIYKKNFLKNVILRVDFDNIDLVGLKNFFQKIVKQFPISEEEQGEEGTINFNFKTKELKQESSAFTSWNLFNKKRTIKIKISPSYLIAEYSNYKDSLELLSSIKTVNNFLDSFKIKTINRLGLRYINEIKLDSKDPLDWGNFINKKLLGLIDFAQSNEKIIARSMGFLVIKEDFGDINFNYGLWNSSYPSPVMDKVFVLDFDAHSKFPL